MDHMAEERKEMKILHKNAPAKAVSKLKSMHKGKRLGLSKSMGCSK